MSKKRFVEFYLSAMMKAATAGVFAGWRISTMTSNAPRSSVSSMNTPTGEGCGKSRSPTSTCWGLRGP